MRYQACGLGTSDTVSECVHRCASRVYSIGASEAVKVWGYALVHFYYRACAGDGWETGGDGCGL
jgi:hypothetical protein